MPMRPPSFLPAQADHHQERIRELSSRHCSAAFGASLLIARCPRLMGRFFPAFGTDAVASGAYRKTSAPASTATSSHASACSGTLSPWSCSVSSWHSRYLLCFLFFIETP
jgi:hypothetical protein